MLVLKKRLELSFVFVRESPPRKMPRAFWVIPSVGILNPAMLHGIGLLFHCQLTLNVSTMTTWVDCVSSTSQRFSGSVASFTHRKLLRDIELKVLTWRMWSKMHKPFPVHKLKKEKMSLWHVKKGYVRSRISTFSFGEMTDNYLKIGAMIISQMLWNNGLLKTHL